MNLQNKVAIVTGASSGIGLAVSKLFAKNGVKVALVARSKNKLKKTEKELPHSFAVPCDMTKEDEIRNMVRRVNNHYGKIDILINNAGQGYDAPVEKINIDIFRFVINLDLIGPLIAMQQVIPIMRKQKEGVIINISSGTALMYLPYMSAYSSLKRALVGISLTAREELKRDNISVSVVYPYITLTGFEKNTIKEVGEVKQEDDGGLLHPPDTAEYIARKILKGMKNDEAEIFAHYWMKKGGENL